MMAEAVGKQGSQPALCFRVMVTIQHKFLAAPHRSQVHGIPRCFPAVGTAVITERRRPFCRVEPGGQPPATALLAVGIGQAQARMELGKDAAAG